MKPLHDLADDRLLVGCVYCGRTSQLNEEHAPSRALLDRPLPLFPPKLQACAECNRSYSLDEEYVAVWLGCVLSGSTDPDCQVVSRVARSLEHSPALRARIEAARADEVGKVSFRPEAERLTRIVRKLAVGHAAYELSIAPRFEPMAVYCAPLSIFTDEERERWDDPEFIKQWGEVGSRGMQRAVIIQASLIAEAGEELVAGVVMNDWVTVQKDVYRYHVAQRGERIRVRMTLREYLACEVVWSDSLAETG